MRLSASNIRHCTQIRRVYVDGALVERVTEIDMRLGSVRSVCTDGHTGHSGQAHIDPRAPEAVCTKMTRGRVRLEMSPEAEKWYVAEGGRMPGSGRTKRLRKKRLSVVADWWLRRERQGAA